MTGCFLDTSALFAMASRGETGHTRCRDAFEGLMRRGRSLVTTELVLAELHALALGRVGPDHAAALVERLGASPRIEVAPATRELRDGGIALLRARPGRRYSLADATSFVVMRDLDIDTAFTLDADFGAEGFTVLPAP